MANTKGRLWNANGHRILSRQVGTPFPSSFTNVIFPSGNPPSVLDQNTTVTNPPILYFCPLYVRDCFLNAAEQILETAQAMVPEDSVTVRSSVTVTRRQTPTSFKMSRKINSSTKGSESVIQEGALASCKAPRGTKASKTTSTKLKKERVVSGRKNEDCNNNDTKNNNDDEGCQPGIIDLEACDNRNHSGSEDRPNQNDDGVSQNKHNDIGQDFINGEITKMVMSSSHENDDSSLETNIVNEANDDADEMDIDSEFTELSNPCCAFCQILFSDHFMLTDHVIQCHLDQIKRETIVKDLSTDVSLETRIDGFTFMDLSGNRSEIYHVKFDFLGLDYDS